MSSRPGGREDIVKPTIFQIDSEGELFHVEDELGNGGKAAVNGI